MADWSELGDRVDDGQPSAREVRHETDYPFHREYVEVRDANGIILGTMIVESLIPKKPTPFADRAIRVALTDDLLPPTPDSKMHKLMKDGFRQFNDEDMA